MIIRFEIIMAWELKWFCMRLLFALDTLEGWSFPLGEAVFLLHCGNVCSPTRGSSTEWRKEIYIYTRRCCIFVICNLYNLYDFGYVFCNMYAYICIYTHTHYIYNIHLRTVYLLMILSFREGWCLGAQHLGVSNWCRWLGEINMFCSDLFGMKFNQFQTVVFSPVVWTDLENTPPGVKRIIT